MSVLSDIEILAELGNGRLVIDPAPDRDRIGVAVDLSLHDHFWSTSVPQGEGIQTIVDTTADPYRYLDEMQAEELVLKSGEFVLGETAERIGIPLHLCGLIEGKSGVARHGLIVHCTAPKIDPGWGTPNPRRITLELVNHGKIDIRLRAGAPIAQLLLLRLGSPSLKQYAGRHMTKGTS